VTPRSRPLRIGITGPIGCGKSTVAGWLGDLGATVIDADELAREVVEPGEPAFDAVVAAFGPSVRSSAGGLDRAALGRLVFGDPSALRRLEAIVHPAVRRRILAGLATAAAGNAPAVAVEAIKLVEWLRNSATDLAGECDPAVQRARVISKRRTATPTPGSGPGTFGELAGRQPDHRRRCGCRSRTVVRPPAPRPWRRIEAASRSGYGPPARGRAGGRLPGQRRGERWASRRPPAPRQGGVADGRPSDARLTGQGRRGAAAAHVSGIGSRTS
jgi:dephospho-CoA kinase